MQARATRQVDQTTFVLVHGAWYGGWCWRRVVARLLADGHRVYAPTLTGLGDRSHLLSPSVRLGTHVDDIVNLILWEDLDNVVLCGHSYGGMVVTGAVESLQNRVKALVYLDAIVARAGQSLMDCLTEANDSLTPKLFDELARDSNGSYLKPLSAELFGVGESDRAWVDSKCTLHPYATFKEPVPSTAAREAIARKIYVLATQPTTPVLASHAKRLESDPSWTVIQLPFGHDLMIDAPGETFDVLMMAGS